MLSFHPGDSSGNTVGSNTFGRIGTRAETHVAAMEPQVDPTEHFGAVTVIQKSPKFSQGDELWCLSMTSLWVWAVP